MGVVNNKRIIKNSMYLYVRMIVLMLVSLYTVRVFLRELGDTDYGIFNVVGSVVSMCSFLVGSLTTASNRFFSIEIVKPNYGNLNKIFCLNILVFLSLFICICILLETIGLWYIQNKMVIPAERAEAAFWVFQCSIVSLGFTFIQVPYLSLITTHEHMKMYATISLFEACFKLLTAYIISRNCGDKLITYAGLMCAMSALCGLCYYAYCRRNFKESRFHFYWDKAIFKQIFSFCSWHLLGTTSSVVKGSGTNILINVFTNPAVNAARGIAYQVESAVLKLSDGFFTAMRPQLYKAYAANEYDSLNELIHRTTIISVFLISLLSFPLLFNAEFILSLWLNSIPTYTVCFLYYVLIESALNSGSNSVILTILATGKQKYYQIWEFILRAIAIPVSYTALSYGCEPYATSLICAICALGSVIMRSIMLHYVFPSFNIRANLILWARIILISFATFVIVYSLTIGHNNSWNRTITTSLLSILILSTLYMFFILQKNDRMLILRILKTQKK